MYHFILPGHAQRTQTPRPHSLGTYYWASDEYTIMKAIHAEHRAHTRSFDDVKCKFTAWRTRAQAHARRTEPKTPKIKGTPFMYTKFNLEPQRMKNGLHFTLAVRTHLERNQHKVQRTELKTFYIFRAESVVRIFRLLVFWF